MSTAVRITQKQPSLSRDGDSAFLLGPYDLARDARPTKLSVCLF